MSAGGVEPTRSCLQWILSPQSLWISLNIIKYPGISLNILEYPEKIFEYRWISLSIIEYHNHWISLNIIEYHRIPSQSIGKAPPRGRPSKPIARYTLELGLRWYDLPWIEKVLSKAFEYHWISYNIVGYPWISMNILRKSLSIIEYHWISLTRKSQKGLSRSGLYGIRCIWAWKLWVKRKVTT